MKLVGLYLLGMLVYEQTNEDFFAATVDGLTESLRKKGLPSDALINSDSEEIESSNRRLLDALRVHGKYHTQHNLLYARPYFLQAGVSSIYLMQDLFSGGKLTFIHLDTAGQFCA